MFTSKSTSKNSGSLFSTAGLGNIEEFQPSVQKKAIKQGFRNAEVLSNKKSKRWPSWIEKQLDPTSPFFQSQNNPHSVTNDCLRSWTTIEHPSTGNQLHICKQGTISNKNFDWAIEAYIKNKSGITPLVHEEKITQHLNADTSSLTTSFNIENASVTQTITPIPNTKSFAIQIDIESSSNIEFILGISPFTALGVGKVEGVTYLSTHELMINKTHSLTCDQQPTNIVCGDFDSCEAFINGANYEKILQGKSKTQTAGAFLVFDVKGENNSSTNNSSTNDSPKQSLNVVLTPSQSASVNNNQQALEAANPSSIQVAPSQQHTDTVEFISSQNFISEKTKNLAVSSAWQLMNQSSSYMKKLKKRPTLENCIKFQTIVRSLVHANLHDKATAIIEEFINTDTPFNWGAATAAHYYYDQTNDEDFLRKIIHKIEKHRLSAHQLKHLCKPIDHPNFFLAIPVLADLEASANIAKDLHKYDTEKHFQSVSNLLANHIFSECKKLKSDSGTQPLPFEALCLIWPFMLAQSDESLVSAILENIENHAVKDGLVIKKQIPAGIPTFSNMWLFLAKLISNESENSPIVSWLESVSAQSGAWPKGIHPRTQEGAFGTGHYLPMSAIFCLYALTHGTK